MKRICVFMGSSSGARPQYAEVAEAFGALLATRGIGLVYGGASVGLMGIVANAVLSAGGEAIGVIPSALVERELAERSLTDLRIVGSMHERKALMAELSDGFAVLPGGLGTLEELFEVLTWGQLGFHRKPCGLINVEGYYDSLLAFLDNSVAERFVSPEGRRSILVAQTGTELLDLFAGYTPPSVEKWLKWRSEL